MNKLLILAVFGNRDDVSKKSISKIDSLTVQFVKNKYRE